MENVVTRLDNGFTLVVYLRTTLKTMEFCCIIILLFDMTHFPPINCYNRTIGVMNDRRCPDRLDRPSVAPLERAQNQSKINHHQKR
jgi:hypothetical protein